jgi:hypothetical protein
MALAVSGWVGLAGLAGARVGETQPDIDERLMVDHQASPLSDSDPLVYPNGTMLNSGYGRNNGGGRRGGPGGGQSQGFAFSVIDNLVLEAQGLPIPAPGKPVRRSSDFDHHFYFKSDDSMSADSKLQQEGDAQTGWVYEVYFYKGVSELEIYRRVGVPLQDSEVDQILALNHASSSWKHASVKATSDGDPTDSFLGYDYERADGKVRGLKVDNDLVLFSAALDARLIEMKKKADEMQASGTSAEEASSTVKGF